MVTKNDLKKLKKIEKEILDDYVLFCKDNGLNYYLAYGSLLGAVRHKGFIPWDDDIDVHMLPGDYLKFLKIYKNNKDYILQNIDTEKYFHSVFSKIRKDKSCMVEESWQYIPIHKGINIDIFPLFPYPDSKIGKSIFNIKLRIATILISKNLKSEKVINKIIYFILRIIPRGLTNKIASKIIINLLNYRGKYHQYKSELKNEIFDVSWFSSSVSLSFEDTLYNAPGGYKEMLCELYGDYMKLPNEEERYGHGCGKIILSFDKNYDELRRD